MQLFAVACSQTHKVLYGTFEMRAQIACTVVITRNALSLHRVRKTCQLFCAPAAVSSYQHLKHIRGLRHDLAEIVW
jgi:hypothetical protein